MMRPFAGALLLAALAAAPPTSGRAQAPGGLDAVVRRIDGSEAAGTVTVAADGTVAVAAADGGATATFPLADVLAIEPRAARQPAETPAPFFVWLRSGSRFPALAATATAPGAEGAARVTFRLASGGEVAVALRDIAALRARPVEPATFAADRKAPDRNLDWLFVVKDGKPQRFPVTVQSLHDGRVHFDLHGKPYTFPLLGDDGTAGIVFGVNTGFAPDRQGRPRTALTTTTGEFLEGKLLQLDERLRLRLDEGCEVVLPPSAVQRIDVLSDKLTWLATLEPKVQQTPAFDRLPPWTTDGSPVGPGIVLGGVTYARGVELVPRTRLVYDLGGRYDTFEATIGIDDRGGPQAHAIFRVFVDGAMVFESEPMTRGKAPQALKIDLGRCRELALEADFGRNFDLGDLCAFADARVVQH